MSIYIGLVTPVYRIIFFIPYTLKDPNFPVVSMVLYRNISQFFWNSRYFFNFFYEVFFKYIFGDQNALKICLISFYSWVFLLIDSFGVRFTQRICPHNPSPTIGVYTMISQRDFLIISFYNIFLVFFLILNYKKIGWKIDIPLQKHSKYRRR